MTGSSALGCVSPRRFAFLLTPATVRAVIPRGVAGVYMLLKIGTPLYIGRSDSCVRGRIASHALASLATHFVWEPCLDHRQAFLLESFWYHRIRDLPGVLNVVHPASPRAVGTRCPFCAKADVEALAYALSRDPTIVSTDGVPSRPNDQLIQCGADGNCGAASQVRRRLR